jgi:tRNA splicing ligase
VIGASYKWCLQHDCMAIASVCSTSIQQQILEQTRQKTGMNLAGFATQAEAEQWCREQLAERLPPNVV